MPRCLSCDSDKPETEYYKNANSKSGRVSTCKTCTNARVNAYKKKNPESTKQHQRKTALMANHGITVEEYDRLFASQNGVCAICKSPPSNRLLAVDHCHEFEAIRGLLCENCNRGIGIFKDDANLLRAAAEYLDLNGWK